MTGALRVGPRRHPLPGEGPAAHTAWGSQGALYLSARSAFYLFVRSARSRWRRVCCLFWQLYQRCPGVCVRLSGRRLRRSLTVRLGGPPVARPRPFARPPTQRHSSLVTIRAARPVAVVFHPPLRGLDGGRREESV